MFLPRPHLFLIRSILDEYRSTYRIYRGAQVEQLHAVEVADDYGVAIGQIKFIPSVNDG